MHAVNYVGLLGVMLFTVPPPHSLAAQPAVEAFSAGANGWVGSSSIGTGIWTFTGGAARVIFVDPGIGFPDLCTLSNTPGATAGAFTGNYETAGIEAIGFSFLAPSALPASSTVELEWGGNTSVFRRAFSITQTGIWYRCIASMLEQDKNQWTATKGSLTDFAAARQSVNYVSIRLARTLTVPHHFVIDDIFVAGMPGGASMSHDTNGRIAWDGLLAGIVYQIESTTNLISASWIGIESLTATGNLHTTSITNSTRETEAFRIRFQ